MESFRRPSIQTDILLNIRLGSPVVISGLLLFHRSRGHYCLTLIYLNKLFIAKKHNVRVESF